MINDINRPEKGKGKGKIKQNLSLIHFFVSIDFHIVVRRNSLSFNWEKNNVRNVLSTNWKILYMHRDFDFRDH